MTDWIHDWTGGEGKLAERMYSRDNDIAPPPTSAAPSRAQVKAVQADLAELGYDPGLIDGFVGVRTEAAIKAYQEDAGMKVDGLITEDLVASLAAAPRPKHLRIHVENAGIPPLYDAGDAFVWSDGRVETVIKVVGSKLFWRVDNGAQYTADRNFLIPPSSWWGPLGAGEADARLDERTSWPLKEESPLVFDVADGGPTEKWRCVIDGTERVSVPAGRFDAVALACERYPAPAGQWVRRVWLYAPAVHHYVVRTDIMADGSRKTVELVGIRPGAENWPPAARAGLDRAIQDALNELPDGQSGLWSSTYVKEEFEILPGATRNNGNGGRCRVFELTARSAGSSRLYPALACLPAGGKEWRISVDGGSESGGIPILSRIN